MPGNRTGGLKATATNKAKYGSSFYREIGKMGGMARNPNKGFGGNRRLAVIAGAAGGKKSKRGPAKKILLENNIATQGGFN